MNLKKLLASGILCTAILAGNTVNVYAASTKYTIQKGDTYWIISQKFGVPIGELMSANGADQNTILYIGQTITIPGKKIMNVQTSGLYTVQKGDTYWKLSQRLGININELLRLNGANENTYLYIGQQIKLPSGTVAQQQIAADKPYITYKSYIVQKGDILYNIANKFGIPLSELLKANNLSESSSLAINQIIKIPVHVIPVKSTSGPQYGEALDWWTEAQYVVPIGASFEVVDFYTGKSFYAKRSTGANHADCEALTLSDTQKIKEIWGGSFSWTRRPVLIKYNGRQIAASMSAMPHAGNDGATG